MIDAFEKNLTNQKINNNNNLPVILRKNDRTVVPTLCRWSDGSGANPASWLSQAGLRLFSLNRGMTNK